MDATPTYVAHLKRRLNTFGFLEDLISMNNVNVFWDKRQAVINEYKQSNCVFWDAILAIVS